MTNFIFEYWEKIQSGEISACHRLKQQYEKVINEIHNPRDPWVFDLEAGTRPIDFVEKFCKQSKGQWIGQSLELDLFQKAKIQAVFGFIHKDTGFRRVREVFTLVGRKNGKSTEKAAIGLYMMIADGEGGAEVYSVATKKDQAKIVFTEHAIPMVSQSPYLSKHTRKRKTDLYFPATFSKFEPLASDSNSLDGLNVHNGIMDELHAIKDRNLYDVIKQSMSSRQQPILDMITTAGFVRECIFDSIYDYACKVLDGVITDDRFMAFIYELDDREEWTDFRCWEKANPGLGTIKDYDELAANVDRAKNDPDFLPTVLTKDFNVRETVAGTWLTFDQINNDSEYDIEYLRDSYAISGTDLSSTTDLSCATLLVMKPDDPNKYIIQHYWLPEDLADQREKEDKIPYKKWSERGLLSFCPGNKVDYSMVTAWYIKMMEEYGIRPYWNVYDPWNAQYWTQEMIDYGFNMIKCRQGAQTFSNPMKEMGADLAAKNINYNNNPILKWCLTNTSVERDKNDNIRPIRGKLSRLRIDGTLSMLMAYVGLFENYTDYQNLI